MYFISTLAKLNAPHEMNRIFRTRIWKFVWILCLFY